MSVDIDKLKYPIGECKYPLNISAEDIEIYSEQIKSLPSDLGNSIKALNDEQLDTPYRDGGWTVRQLVHHIADSHLNGYIRMKWALTEEESVIKTYDQNDWVELPDTYNTPVHISVDLLKALHERWYNLIAALSEEQLSKKLKHPEKSYDNVAQVICAYAWHGRHHTAHITELRKRMGW